MLLSKKIPFYYAILIAVLSVMAGSLFSALAYQRFIAINNTPVTQPSTLQANLSGCDYIFPRLNGYHFIRPLLYADQNCESGKYKPMKEAIGALVDKLKSEGTLANASVYVRDFDESAWICYNPDEKYDPASLLKIPVLIACLRQAEEQPNLLNMEIPYPTAFPPLRQVHFPSETIKPGRKFTVHELLHAIIAHSDNDATQLLMDHIGIDKFLKTFTDLGLPQPNRDSAAYLTNVKDCSVFLKVLYDASYLNIRNSEYATSLLAECDFKQGIVSGLPPTVKVANKFGEAGFDQMFELSETAIVYFDKSPYLLTIMTRGNDMKKLPGAISRISTLVHNNMAYYN